MLKKKREKRVGSKTEFTSIVNARRAMEGLQMLSS